MRKMVIHYEHNAMWLSQDIRIYQEDTTKHRGTTVGLPHTHTYCQNAQRQLSEPALNFLCGYPIQRDEN